VLERFLYRLSVSAHRDHLILKGGMLLSAFGQRRPTRDIDLLAKATPNEPAAVAALVSEIAALQAGDGVSYETSQITTRIIREQDLYAAVRVAVPARIGRGLQPLKEIMIINHDDCGMLKFTDGEMEDRLRKQTGTAPIAPAKFYSFTDAEANTKEQIRKTRSHPWILPDVPVRGFVFDENTGRLSEVFPDRETATS
jgi:Nucleotidyl transferase AbiEii toxin, Type IV TA system